MDINGLIYRNEWKYLISLKEADLLKRRLLPFTHYDPHTDENGSYMIRSLYFDDWKNSCYNQKLMGVYERQKWRIRTYNITDVPQEKYQISLERKRKLGSYIHKDSANLTPEEFYKILDGDYGFLLKKEKNFYKEFYYELTSNLYRPKVIVDYDRVPLIVEEGTVRITFDRDVRAAYGSYDILDGSIPTMSCLEPDHLILEVKYTEFLPQIIKELLPMERQIFMAYSKYTSAFEAVHHITDMTAGVNKSGRFGGRRHEF